MEQVPRDQVLRRLRSENPWWETGEIPPDLARLSPRRYLDLFLPLVLQEGVRRAVVLMGPRRVGKTVLQHHAIAKLIAREVPPKRIAYIAVDHPIYNDLGLQDLLDCFAEATGVDPDKEPCWVFFDEIQYLRKWEVHLKTLVDSHRSLHAFASGSAAAALKLKSDESGAGRFTDFLLPPLTFVEYLDLLGLSGIAAPVPPAELDLALVNRHFLDYINRGGYPEVLFSEPVRRDPGRFVKSDIIDKVLLRDLPSLYGISDIQELNYLFTTLAYNTAGEVSLEELARNSGVAKPTIKRYIEYLEAAFLLRALHRVDRTGRRFQRARNFKVYLTNPSIRAALFAPVDQNDPKVGALVESAVIGQWFHSDLPFFYANWERGEVDLVHVRPGVGVEAAGEVKWSDRYYETPGELRSLLSFCAANRLDRALVTTRTRRGTVRVGGVELQFVPASLLAHSVGAHILANRAATLTPADLEI
jgi:predicted AAA+ superfamily ATPase